MNVDIKRICSVCSFACELYLCLSRSFDGVFGPKVWNNNGEKGNWWVQSCKCNKLRTMKLLLCRKWLWEAVAMNKCSSISTSVWCISTPNSKLSVINETLPRFLPHPRIIRSVRNLMRICTRYIFTHWSTKSEIFILKTSVWSATRGRQQVQNDGRHKSQFIGNIVCLSCFSF